MPGASGSTITVATWLRYVTRHLQNCGMDSVFYIPKKGTTEPLYFLCTEWGKINTEDVDAYLQIDTNFDKYDKQNLNWSGEFLQDSISIELWTAIEPDMGLRLSGPRILAAVICQYRATASITIRNLMNQLMEMSLAKTPGENVETLSNKIFDTASQIEGLGEAPSDLASLVAARFLKSTSQAFCSKAMSVFERTQDFDNPMRWTEVLQQLKSVYATLKGQNMWEAIEPPKADAVMAAVQKEIAELKRCGKQDKEDSGKPEGETTKKNLIKSHPAPKEGEPTTKVIDRKECSYCSRCGRWTFGSKKHTTKEHRTAAELKAAKANAKKGESANVAADATKNNQDKDKSNTGTLAMMTGFFSHAVNHCKLTADF